MIIRVRWQNEGHDHLKFFFDDKLSAQQFVMELQTAGISPKVKQGEVEDVLEGIE